MSLVYQRIEDMSDAHWADAHKAFYSLKLHRVMGGPTEYEVPPLQAFYNETMDAIDAGTLHVWSILRDDEYVGHVILTQVQGEWEIGVALVHEEDWGGGMGVRAGLYALRFAFEELGAKQVIAFAYNPDGHARNIILKTGFRPFMNFLLLPVEVWEKKWARRMK